jgi:transposase
LATEDTTGSRKGRPNYSLEFKKRLAQAACEADVSVAQLALWHGINANMLFKWRRHYRAGLFDEPMPEPVMLLPVSVCDTPNGTEPPLRHADARMSETPTVMPSAGIIEITFAHAVVRVDGGVDAVTLRAVLQSLNK